MAFNTLSFREKARKKCFIPAVSRGDGTVSSPYLISFAVLEWTKTDNMTELTVSERTMNEQSAGV